MKHTGIVVSVTKDRTAVVEVMREHACTGCSEKNACSMESASNIRITFKNAADLNIGDKVEIAIKSKDFFMSMLAVYIAPVIIMLITAITASSLGASQILTASLTLLSTALYFVFLKLKHKGRDKQTYTKI